MFNMIRSVFIAVFFTTVCGLAFAAEKKQNIIEPAKEQPKEIKKEAPQEPVKPEEKKVEPAIAEPAKVIEPQKEEKPVEIPVAEPIVKPEEKALEKKDKWDNGSVGVGMGIFYGFFGINAEYSPIKKKWWNGITIVAGIGQTTIEKFAYNGGIRYYILDRDYFIRPRVTVTYGVNATTNYDITILGDGDSVTYFKDKNTHHGVNVGAGAQLLFGDEKQHGLDFDVVIIAYSTINKRIDDLKKRSELAEYVSNNDKPFPVKISLGYRFCF